MLTRAASKSVCEQKHAALLLDNHRIVAVGYNKPGVTSSYLRRAWNIQTTHAEVAAIVKANYQVPSVMIVVRVRNRRLQNSRPCLSCQTICKYFGVKKIIYSDEFGMFQVMKL